MKLALHEAYRASILGEVPVGAILVQRGEVIAKTYNQTIQLCDPTAHAELLALRQGGLVLKDWRLIDTTLYCTLQPCVMCMEAILLARVRRLVWGAPNGSMSESGYNFDHAHSHSRLQIVEGLYREKVGELMRRFFQQFRKQGK